MNIFRWFRNLFRKPYVPKPLTTEMVLDLLGPRWVILMDDYIRLLNRGAPVWYSYEYRETFPEKRPFVKYYNVKVNLDILNIKHLFENDEYTILDKIPIKAYSEAWYYHHAI